MAQGEDILGEFHSGKPTLDEPAAALTEQPAEPAVATDATMYRAPGTISEGSDASPASVPGSRHDSSGSSSSGWRQWAATDTSGAPVGVGTVLRDRFQIEQRVGEGGMGLVFRARDRRREEAQDRHPFVAIKVLGEDFKSHPDALMSLQREARRMQQLSHPNIASVYDFDRDGPHVYLVMELLEGESLDRVLERMGGDGLPLELARKVLEGAGSALRHAHTRGLVHSDFKPANVFVTAGGEVKVIDFGIARIVKDSTQVGAAAQTVFDAGRLGAWTNTYASPEQMLDGATPDPRDDVYALGLVTYEMLTGKHPFGRKSAIEARFREMRPAPVPMLTARQNAVLASALQFDREHRLADAMALVRSLARDADDGVAAISGIRPERPDQARPAAAARKVNVRTLALAVVALAGLGFLASLWSAREPVDAQTKHVDDAIAAPAPPATTASVAAPVPQVAVAGKRTPSSKAPRDATMQAASRPAGASASTSASVDIAPGAEPEVTDSEQVSVRPEQAAGTTAAPEKPALYRWVDATGTVQFGETPPAEFADSAVKVMDL